MMNKRPLYALARAGILDKADVDQAKDGQVFRSACPVHLGGDETAFALTLGDNVLWCCHSRRCQEVYGGHINGLAIALADKYDDPPVQERQNGRPERTAAMKWLERNPSKVRDALKDREAARLTSDDGPGPKVSPYCWTRQKVVDSLVVPSPHFLARGFSAELLKENAIGTPKAGGLFDKPWLRGWAIVPLWDLNRGTEADVCVGFTARNPTNDGLRWRFPKGLPARQQLFGFQSAARASMRGCRRVIMTEGVADCLRCHQAGFPGTVATLTNSISDGQVVRLEDLRPSEVVVFRDNGEPGEALVKAVREKIGGRFGEIKVVMPPASFKDVGEIPVAAAREMLLTEVG